MNNLCLSITTFATKSDAEILAEKLIAKKLCACAQIDGPILSFYQWKGEVCQETEWRLLMKFPATRLDELESFVMANHPYDTPQWICLKIDSASPAYLKWANDVTDS